MTALHTKSLMCSVFSLFHSILSTNLTTSIFFRSNLILLIVEDMMIYYDTLVCWYVMHKKIQSWIRSHFKSLILLGPKNHLKKIKQNCWNDLSFGASLEFHSNHDSWLLTEFKWLTHTMYTAHRIIKSHNRLLYTFIVASYLILLHLFFHLYFFLNETISPWQQRITFHFKSLLNQNISCAHLFER